MALVCVLSIHVVCLLTVSAPIARPRLRHKVDALTENSRPCLLLAGDSRALKGLAPKLIADRVGLPRSQVVNIAESACDPCAVRSAYEEFSSRFAPRPIMLLDVSFFSMNDGTDAVVGDELLHVLSFRQRCQLVSPGRAISACFLPEKFLFQKWTAFWPEEDTSLREGGFSLVHGGEDTARWSATQIRRSMTELQQSWYGRPDLQGVRWAQLQNDLQMLRDYGVQLVILDPPCQTRFIQALADASLLDADQQFHRQLAQLGQQLGVPVLSCPPGWCGNMDTALLFHDLVHLNRAGATLYSEVVARGLCDLIQAGQVQLETTGTYLAESPTRQSAAY